MNRRILVVDDHPLVTRQIAEIFEADGFEVVPVTDGRTALRALREGLFHVVIAEWSLPDLSGIDLLTTIRHERLPVGVVFVTACGDPEIALEAMKAGADDFVTRPFEPERLRYLVRRVVDRRSLIDELEQLRNRIHSEHGFQELVSKSPKMRRVFDLIERIAPLGSTVLIHGETGTGKELVARALHNVSGRRGSWVPVNCAALQESLLESELFGHERGSFTGADRQRIGRFELADGGTLFLDEIAEISPQVQAKLLRVLQCGQFERVGGNKTLHSDARVVAASNRRLEDEVAAGRFRADLFFRLSVIRVDLPPLRDRTEDIPLLAAHFLDRLKSKSTPPVTEIRPDAMQALLDHHWPGNVRELENAIKAAVAMADGTYLSREALPVSVAPRAVKRAAAKPLVDIDRPLQDTTQSLISRVEREYFAQLLARYRGNIARCARHSGLSRRCVTQKLMRYNLDREEFRLTVSQERQGG